jgi:hypothetical protein
MHDYIITKRHTQNCYDNCNNSEDTNTPKPASNGLYIADIAQWKQAKSKADLKATLLLLTQERFAVTAATVATAWLD